MKLNYELFFLVDVSLKKIKFFFRTCNVGIIWGRLGPTE